VLEAGWRIAAFALLALVVAIVLGWTALLPLSLGALGAFYGLQLAVDDAGLDLATPLVAVGLVLTAELAYWSLEERERVAGKPGESLRRLVYVAAVALGAFIVVAVLLALVDAVRTGGLAVDLLGAAAAAAALIAIVLAARGRDPASR
jgi:ABC-type Na+ efflux pump permease subunit